MAISISLGSQIKLAVHLYMYIIRIEAVLYHCIQTQDSTDFVPQQIPPIQL